MTTTTTSAHEPEPLLNVAGLSKALGGVPPQTIYRWRTEGKGPRAIKVGRHLRFRRADVEAWLDSQADDERGQR